MRSWRGAEGNVGIQRLPEEDLAGRPERWHEGIDGGTQRHFLDEGGKGKNHGKSP